jgi:hypothetical protein
VLKEDVGDVEHKIGQFYATSIAARTLSMATADILAAITEFVGAVGMGTRITDTMKNGINGIDRFEGKTSTIMLANGLCGDWQRDMVDDCYYCWISRLNNSDWCQICIPGFDQLRRKVHFSGCSYLENRFSHYRWTIRYHLWH